MTEKEVLRYIQMCTREFGGVDIAALRNRFPPDAEYFAMRWILRGLLKRGVIRLDGETGRYVAA